VDDRTVEISAGDGIVRLVIDPATGLPQQLLYDSPQPNGPPKRWKKSIPIFASEWNPGAFSRDLSSGWQIPGRVHGQPVQINTGLQLEDLERRP